MMKTFLFPLVFTSILAIGSCSNGPREENDDKDSLDAVRSADSMLQQELNSDTSASSLDSIDTIGEMDTSRSRH